MSLTFASSADTTNPTDPPDALLSLSDLLVAVLDDEAATPDFSHLDDLKLETITDPSPASHLIATTFLDVLAHAQKRRAQKKRANGGRREPRGSRLDLYQPRLSQEELSGMLTGDACEELFTRLEQAVRLAVLARRSSARDKALWKKQHRALALALVRVQDVCARLCSPTGGWFLLVCLKWLLEVLWEKLFGQRVPASVKARLIYTIMEVEYDLACSFLVAEVLRGDAPPVPFAGAVAACLHQLQALARVLRAEPAGVPVSGLREAALP